VIYKNSKFLKEQIIGGQVMKKFALLVLILISIFLFTGCKLFFNSTSDAKSNIVISEKTLDMTVDKAKAKSLGQHLLDAVPPLSTLRNKLEKETGKKIKLSISVQSSPNTEGINALEKNNYYMYVSYANPDGLVHTYTFLINKDDNRILVFGENGDDTISVEEWAKSVGVN